MENEKLNIEELTPERFDELLERHEREVQLGNVPDARGNFRPADERRRWFRPLLLFIATCLSTYYVGVLDSGWVGGAIYSVSLMSILLCHEMGHFLQSVRYHVPASLPYFIPMPIPPIGTMGAVIVQRRGAGDRKALFDIAISGPLAGLAIALPMAYFGILWSQKVYTLPTEPEFILGSPLIFQWLIDYLHPSQGQGFGLEFHPMAAAGWVGIFITALNLSPVSQLDGGHIMYALLRKKAHLATKAFLGMVIFYMILTWQFQWLLMVALVLFMGPYHPPTANDNIPLSRGRKILGWLTLAFFIIGITPVPIRYYDPSAQSRPPARSSVSGELIQPTEPQ